jgi:hypothetical protein
LRLESYLVIGILVSSQKQPHGQKRITQFNYTPHVTPACLIDKLAAFLISGNFINTNYYSCLLWRTGEQQSINQSINQFIVPQNKSMKVKKKNKQKLCETTVVSREAQELISRKSFVRSDNKINRA